MDGFLVAIGSAFWLGVLTSISPCPLATNVAAISFVGRSVVRPSAVFVAGLLYTLGRVLAYVLLGGLLVASVLSSPQLSLWLQQHLNKFLGPLLVLVGMVLLGLIGLGAGGSGVGSALGKRLAGWGVAGSALLGLLFALSFCPVSAALFFGSLVPLAVRAGSNVLLPTAYGIGTGLPVLVFAVLIAFGARSLGKAFQGLSQVEWYARRGTGVVILMVGVYLTLHHVYGLV